MKKIFAAFAVFAVSSLNYAAQSAEKNFAELLYFHGAQRCFTCNAIEKSAKEVVENNFQNEIKDGKLVFKVVDISKKENEALADKYKISFSSLCLVLTKDGKESVLDMTRFAFANARRNPEQFKEALAQTIKETIKQL